MKLFSSIWLTISTYSILPTPRIEWRGENMRGAICFLPLVGIFIGGALMLWQWLCIALKAEAALFAAVAAVLPLLLSGGIHMDGFMDTMDALGSRQSRERKLEIMKDPHTGAFAVMCCAAYLLLSFGLYWALYHRAAWWPVALGFILSRALCGLSALTLPNARNGGMLFEFTVQAKTRAAVVIMCALFLLCSAAMMMLNLWPGLSGTALTAAVFWRYRRMAIKQFGGVTGDTCGFFIQLCELCLLFGVWLGGCL